MKLRELKTRRVGSVPRLAVSARLATSEHSALVLRCMGDQIRYAQAMPAVKILGGAEDTTARTAHVVWDLAVFGSESEVESVVRNKGKICGV